MKPVEILEKAKELISDPARWTRGCTARNLSGRNVLSNSDQAVCWCAVGSLWKIIGDDNAYSSPPLNKAWQILENAAVFNFKMSAATVNDHLGHEKTMEMFDLAIVVARKTL